ncbi:MAG: hypothetical protein NC218_03010 [Acetobacter sp.]|nr:hypothetical protein [Acetobacter sp.]
MKYRAFVIVFFLLSLGFSTQTYAQLLDDEEIMSDSYQSMEGDNDEALFNEMFNDFPESEKDITKVKTFDDAIERFSQEIKNKQLSSEENILPVPTQITPLVGDMSVGIQKGSFKIFRDISGRSRCSFNVALKSELDRNIKVLALNLVYAKRVFAFVFKDVPMGETQLRHITTGGDICYHLTGVPDIRVHNCKIKGALANDCLKHIKWSDNLE